MKVQKIHGAAEPNDETKQLLLRCAPLAHGWSRTGCRGKVSGGMEEWAKTNSSEPRADEFACDWYHGTWQFLRLLNMVAVPPWYAFYENALAAALRDNPRGRVLVAACADFGMLATLHSAVRATEASPSILVVDICDTPLRACEWYASHFGFEIQCRRGNLLDAATLQGELFDLIVTDEFLTVIKGSDKPVVAGVWHELLAPNGQLVTTAMIGGPTSPELRRGYSARARNGWIENPELAKQLGVDLEDLIESSKRFAALHNRYMLSDEAELKEIFREFDLAYTRIETPGECVNPTWSFQVVAKRRQ